jgi:hypothetical protein
MSEPIRALDRLLREMAPELQPGAYAYVSLPLQPPPPWSLAVATIREAEGWSLIVDEAEARTRGWHIHARCAWISLRVHSDLHAIGLTAAVAQALAAAGIACNVVAGALHDHLFVPVDQAERALAILRGLGRPLDL